MHPCRALLLAVHDFIDGVDDNADNRFMRVSKALVEMFRVT